MICSYTKPVILHPRPLERQAGGILLLPLLPYPRPLKPLPVEIWEKILTFAYYDDEDLESDAQCVEKFRRELLSICKSLNAVASPVFYSRVWIRSVRALEKFTCRLHSADQKWDSIRRIPYSAPGRWVQSLDLTGLDCATDGFVVDELLTRLFPLLPFMAHFILGKSIVLSRRAFGALTFRDGAQHLKTLMGIRAPVAVPRDHYHAAVDVDNDTLVQLLRNCPHLEELEIIGPGFDPVDVDFATQFTDIQSEREVSMKHPLRLDSLAALTILSTHSSPLMHALLATSLPALRRLIITPYDDIPHPASIVSRFIRVHGHALRSLYLFTPRDIWPTTLHPSPKDLLISCPELNHLSLEYPLPKLILPPHDSDGPCHPLQILSIPRPKSDYLNVIEGMIPVLGNLKVVRTRDVRWLRRGMAPRALEAGVQGEMREWRRRLSCKGVVVLDTDNKEMNQ